MIVISSENDFEFIYEPKKENNFVLLACHHIIPTCLMNASNYVNYAIKKLQSKSIKYTIQVHYL